MPVLHVFSVKKFPTSSMSQFKSICPHCFMHYTLDTAYLGKFAQCGNCRETFMLERVSETLTLASDMDNDSNLDRTDSEVRDQTDSDPPAQSTTTLESPNPSPLASQNFIKSSQESTYHHSESVNNEATSSSLPSSRSQSQRGLSTETLTASTAESSGFFTGIWNVGEVVLGIYEVMPIAPNLPYAQGGVGIVQKIYHREWDIELAVKSPKLNAFRSEGGISSYERECQTWVELGLHPNIVTCYLVRRIGGIPRIFAEFIPDGSLRDWIVDLRLYKGGPNDSLLRILDIAIQFAWGLDYAHRQGLLHLDVKPANVMMSGSIPKVTDFGLAQATTADSLSQGLAVDKWEGMTPGFCSPEQYQAYLLYRNGVKDSSLRITAQSDIWSWAISILTMFHGRAPCRKGGQTAAKVFEMFLESPVSNDQPQMPPAMVDLMRHCFQEAPKDRPRSMAEVAERLIEIYRQAGGGPYPRTVPSITRLTMESLNNQAVSLLDLNKFKDAESLFHEALQKHPWQPELTYNQSLHLWRNGKLTDLEAIDRLETLVKILGEPVSYFALGLAQRERGNTTAARRAFETALELKMRPDFKRALAATEKIASRGVHCTDRFSVKPQRGPLAFLDEKENILLMVGDSSPFLAYNLKQGQMWLTFKTSEKTNGRQLALSDDFQWEIFSGKTPKQLVLKSVTDPAKNFKLNAVPWGRLQQDVVGMFSMTSWGSSDSALADSKLSDSSRSGLPDPEITHTAGELLVETSEVSTPDTNRTRLLSWDLQIVGKDHEIHVADRASSRLLRTLRGHEDKVVSISHGGRRGEWVLTGSRDRTVRLWELPSGRCVRTLGGLDAPVDAVYLSRSGRFLLVLLGGNSLRVWDVGILCRNSERLHAPVLLCQISSSEEMSRRQSETVAFQEELTAAIDREDFPAAVSSVKRIQNLPSWGTVRSELPWEILIQKCTREKPGDAVCLHTLVGHEDIITSVALSLDGRLAVSAGKDQKIRLWNTLTGKCVKVLTGHQDWIRDIALTWDGRYLLSGSWDTTVRIWDTGTGKCVRVLRDRIRSISRVAFHPQKKLAAIATAAGSVLLWDVVSDCLVGNWLAHRRGVNTIAFNRDGRYLITGGDDAVIGLWDTASQYLIRKHERGKLPITAAKLSLDLQGFVNASKEGTIEIHHFLKKGPANILSGHVAEITGLELLVDNRFFVTTARDQTAKIWNFADGSLLKTLEGHSAPITGLAMDFSGRKMLTGSEDGTLRFWELFWDLSHDGVTDRDQRLTPFLHALLSLFCDADDPSLPPRLDEQNIRRILLELGYRGFGHLQADAVRREIQKLCKRWAGPIRIPEKGLGHRIIDP